MGQRVTGGWVTGVRKQEVQARALGLPPGSPQQSACTPISAPPSPPGLQQWVHTWVHGTETGLDPRGPSSAHFWILPEEEGGRRLPRRHTPQALPSSLVHSDGAREGGSGQAGLGLWAGQEATDLAPTPQLAQGWVVTVGLRSYLGCPPAPSRPRASAPLPCQPLPGSSSCLGPHSRQHEPRSHFRPDGRDSLPGVSPSRAQREPDQPVPGLSFRVPMWMQAGPKGHSRGAFGAGEGSGMH